MARFAWAPLLALGGCSMGGALGTLMGAASDWYEVGPVRKPLPELMETTRLYLVQSGYVVTRMDAVERWLQTEWDVHLNTHWREGFRTKVDVEFPEQPDGSTLIRIRSSREVNTEDVAPMQADRARWMSAATDDKQKPLIPEPAIKLRQQLKIKFFGLAE